MQKTEKNTRKSGKKKVNRGGERKGKYGEDRERERGKGGQIGLQRMRMEKLIKMKEIFGSPPSPDTLPFDSIVSKNFPLLSVEEN